MGKHYMYLAQLLLLPASALAQVSGTVHDQDGAVVPGARIEARNQDSGTARSALSDGSGRYSFEFLAVGNYRIAASAPNFRTAVRTGVEVAPGRAAVADFALELAPAKTVVVVTAPATSKPLVVETDPRAPRQPIPAHDGADYLKNIPGFSVIRKGGADADPVLRGMAGSRLGVLLDGQQILGGCGGRMDPPTAYVFPASYDRITVRKGPQTVQFGPGNSAGTVMFERSLRRIAEGSVSFDSSATAGSFGRHDEMFDARAGGPRGYAQVTGTRSHSGDYTDGAGVPVHSAYTRWSSNLALGWTPGENTLLELSAARSDGRAAYADRAMDGTRFARDNVAVKFERSNLSRRFVKIEALTYYNYIDHIMDNYSLRTPGAAYSSNNPDRKTLGGRLAGTLIAGTATSIVFGSDTQRNIHTLRAVSNLPSAALATERISGIPRREDLRFNQAGFFAEATHNLTQRYRLVGGLREDWHEAMDRRGCVGGASCAAPADRTWLTSGFGRYEHDFLQGGVGAFYAGVGHAERFPDYWERMKQDPITLKSAFSSVRPERTTQFDTGMLWKSGAWSGSVSGFYGKVRDYILIRWMPAPSLTRNVDAATMGGEAEVAWRLARNWKADAAFAYVRSNNETDRKPLAQQPPVEGRFGLLYENRAFSLGGLARLAGPQDRVDIGSGNIVANGMDLGRTGGFTVFSLNGGYRINTLLRVAGGIDNLFDRAYAEHISKAGAAAPGFAPVARLREPGRTLWIKVDFVDSWPFARNRH